MQIISGYAENFASYEELKFAFLANGLTLISGPTGAGKSTLCDLIPWVLFGKTAKNGSADEILSWGSEEKQTYARILLCVKNLSVEIHRRRGHSSKDNDLYMKIGFQEPKRGKDLMDTQKQINTLLGVDIDTYLAGAYFHEFSQTAQFFSTTAKNRRGITEQLVDLSMAKDLQANMADYSKIVKADKEEVKHNQILEQNSLIHISKALENEITKAKKWTGSRQIRETELQEKIDRFDLEKFNSIQYLKKESLAFEEDRLYNIAHIEGEMADLVSKIKPASYYEERMNQISEQIKSIGVVTCPACGTLKENHKMLLLTKDEYAIRNEKDKNEQLSTLLRTMHKDIQRLKNQTNPLGKQIEKEEQAVNIYIGLLDESKSQVNPHEAIVEQLIQDKALSTNKITGLETILKDLELELADLDTLKDLTQVFRTSLISQATDYLEQSTNALLNDYFDAEIRIDFTAEGADNLDVKITKDGNECSYTQLSKGQRQILKLCFGTSVMKAVSNYSGTDFNVVFFDEALDGMDDNMKDKSFNLLSSLEKTYESIFVVEHSNELKPRFTREYQVELTEEGSVINEKS